MGLKIRKDDLDVLIDHCKCEFPNEACGILAGSNGNVSKIYRMVNARPSPVSYEMDPAEQFRVMKEIRQAGMGIVGIYHSHPSCPAYPSAVDVEKAYWPDTLFPNYPEALYIIVSLMGQRHPMVKCFSIAEGAVKEVPLLVE